MTFKRGLAYAQEGRVRMVSAEQWPVVAKVRGSGSSVYIVTLYYEGARYFEADCTCPVATDCKHAVATALVALESEYQDEESYAASRQELAVGSWLSGLGSAPAEFREHSANNRVVVYILERNDEESQISFYRSSYLKRGGLARATLMSSVGDPTRQIPDWVPPDDLRRIALVRALSRSRFYESSYSLNTLDE